jgi:predicted MFS family arabinose efflux permease
VTVLLGHLNVLAALGLARFGYTMILPSMKEGLRLTYEETGWLATGNFVGYLLCSLLAGLLATHWPLRRLLPIALLSLASGLGVTALATGFPAALAARTFTGLASGAVNIPAMVLPTLWFAPHRRGMAAGIQTGGSGLGLILSGLFIPVIIQRVGSEGWRHSWLFLAGLVSLVWILTVRLLRNRPEDVGLFPYGASQASRPLPVQSPRWREVFANRALWGLGAIYACFGFSYVIYATFFAAYLTKEGSLSPAAAGQLWSLVGVLSLGSGVLWGSLADRMGKHLGLAIVFGLHAACFAMFALARAAPLFVASAILFGLSAWSIPAIMAAAVGDYSPLSLTPAALGFITVLFGLGQAVGPPIAGRLADWTLSFSGAFLLAAGVALAGCLSSLLLRPPGRPKT